MESHTVWGLIFIAAGTLFLIFQPLISVIPILIGIALLMFGEREKRIEEVRE